MSRGCRAPETGSTPSGWADTPLLLSQYYDNSLWAGGVEIVFILGRDKQCVCVGTY